MTGITASLLPISQVMAIVSFPQILTTIGSLPATYDLATTPISKTPIIPGNVVITGDVVAVGESSAIDNGSGAFPASALLPLGGTIDYTTGVLAGITATLVADSQVVAAYSGNNNMPLMVPANSSGSVTITIIYTGTINFPAIVTGHATSYNGDQILWTQIVPETQVPLPPPSTIAGTVNALAVVATTQPCLQPIDVINQNYLITVTDSDNDTQIFNVGLSNRVGYPSAELQVINGYPNPRRFVVTPDAPTLLSVTANVAPPPFYLVLNWEAPSFTGTGSITGYRIFRESPLGSGFIVLVPNTGSAETLNSYVDTVVVADTVYNYKVAAISTVGIGSPSNAISQNTGT